MIYDIPILLYFWNCLTLHPEYELCTYTAYKALPENVKINLIDHEKKNYRAAKVIFFNNCNSDLNMKNYLIRTGQKSVDTVKTNMINGIYFPSDNAIFINIEICKNVLWTLHHEFGHLVNHHNLNRHRLKWNELNKNIPSHMSITQQAQKNANESFAECYAMYHMHPEVLLKKVRDFFNAEVYC